MYNNNNLVMMILIKTCNDRVTLIFGTNQGKHWGGTLVQTETVLVTISQLPDSWFVHDVRRLKQIVCCLTFPTHKPPDTFTRRFGPSSINDNTSHTRTIIVQVNLRITELFPFRRNSPRPSRLLANFSQKIIFQCQSHGIN